MDRMVAVLVLLHLLCCVLVYIGIRLGVLRVKRYVLPVVALVPVSGLICCLFLHFRLFFRRKELDEVGLRKLGDRDELNQQLIVDRSLNRNEIIPLEEALILNNTKQKRNLILGILEDHPENYLAALQQARLNEDVEVVHYAATSMAELSQNNDDQYRELKNKWNENQDDVQAVEKFSGFIKDSLGKGLVEGKLEQAHRELFSDLLEKRLLNASNYTVYLDLLENELNLQHYERVADLLKCANPSWIRREGYQMLLIRYYAEMGYGDKVQEQIDLIERSAIYITQKNREKINFWRSEANETRDGHKKLEEVSV